MPSPDPSKTKRAPPDAATADAGGPDPEHQPSELAGRRHPEELTADLVEDTVGVGVDEKRPSREVAVGALERAALAQPVATEDEQDRVHRPARQLDRLGREGE